MSDSRAPTTDAILLLLLRVAALAIAIFGVTTALGPYVFRDTEGITALDLGLAAAAVAVIELGAIALWIAAPRLARRFTIAQVGDAPATASAATIGCALLGLWFLGRGVADLLAVPAHYAAIKAYGVPAGLTDAIFANAPAQVLQHALRIAFGALLFRKSRAIAAWLSRPSAP